MGVVDAPVEVQHRQAATAEDSVHHVGLGEAHGIAVVTFLRRPQRLDQLKVDVRSPVVHAEVIPAARLEVHFAFRAAAYVRFDFAPCDEALGNLLVPSRLFGFATHLAVGFAQAAQLFEELGGFIVMLYRDIPSAGLTDRIGPYFMMALEKILLVSLWIRNI